VRRGIFPTTREAGEIGRKGMKAARKLSRAVAPVPEGYHSITPFLIVRGADRAIDFYKRAFGAKEHGRMPGPDGKSIMHADLSIGNSRFFLSDEDVESGCRSPESLGGASAGIYLYVENVDEVYRKAVEAGGKPTRPVEDMFWGDRTGTIRDPFGYEWSLATHTEDVTPEEMRKRGESFVREMASKRHQ